jgi:hypothetical protein
LPVGGGGARKESAMSQPLSTSLQQCGIERPQPDRVEGRQVGAARDAVGDQRCQGLRRSPVR